MQKEQQIFKLHAPYQPTGDQPQAIEELVRGFKEGNQFETLLGVTGSGKTFTMANVIAQLNKPTLIISHNKTLAAQLYGEFKEFFPENAVEYFVSYYDYYQPEDVERNWHSGQFANHLFGVGRGVVLAFVIGDLRFARLRVKLQLGAAQRVQQQQAIVVLPRLLPEEASINFLFVREICKCTAGLVLA